MKLRGTKGGFYMYIYIYLRGDRWMKGGAKGRGEKHNYILIFFK